MCFRPPEMNRRIKRCPSCQAPNPPAMKICNKCGADLPDEVDLVTGAGAKPGTTMQGVAAPGVSAPGVPAPGVSAPGVPAPGVAAPGTVAPGVSKEQKS